MFCQKIPVFHIVCYKVSVFHIFSRNISVFHMFCPENVSSSYCMSEHFSIPYCMPEKKSVFHMSCHKVQYSELSVRKCQYSIFSAQFVLTRSGEHIQMTWRSRGRAPWSTSWLQPQFSVLSHCAMVLLYGPVPGPGPMDSWPLGSRSPGPMCLMMGPSRCSFCCLFGC